MTDVRRADPGARRQALLWVFVTAALGTALIVLVDRYSVPLREWVLENPDRTPQRIKLVFGAFAAAASAPLLAFAVYLWTLGTGVVRARQFPAPGQRVLHDTEVIEGPAAVRRGRALRIVAGSVAGLCLLFWMLLWRLASLVRSPA